MTDAAPFSAKLALVLKALSISRGRLAADLGIDKSVVSRWMSGVYQPSGENLSQLTRLIAGRHPGFNGLDWERDLAALAALFGGGGQIGQPWASPPALHGAPSLQRARRIAAIDGYWHGWRLLFQDSTRFVRDVFRILPEGEHSRITWVSGNMTQGAGSVTAGDGKIAIVLALEHSDVPAVTWLYTLVGGRMQVMDGMFSGVNALAGRGLISGAYVLVRYADLIADRDAGDRFLNALAAEPCIFDVDAVPPAIAARLRAPVVGDGLMRVSAEASLSRISTVAEDRAAAAIAAEFVEGDMCRQ